MINKNCPNCGSEVEDYFANADDWQVVKNYSCDCHEWSGGLGCKDSSKIEKTTDIVQCQNCEEWLTLHATVETPCGGNEIVLELYFEVEVQAR